jgi:hypothetical protein
MSSPDDRTFGPALAAFMQAQNLKRIGLAAWLGIDEQDLATLADYECPDPDAPFFHEDIMRIFAETGADPAMLRRVARLYKNALQGY